MSEKKLRNGKIFFFEDDIEPIVSASLIGDIYRRMVDNISKRIFENRLIDNLTDDH